MTEKRWGKPVVLMLPGLTKPLWIVTVDQAAAALIRAEWPEIDSQEYRAAQRELLAVIEGSGDRTSARTAFVAAAVRAGVEVRDG